MEIFPDRAYVRLRSRVHGCYLHADEDGMGVNLTPHRASLNTAWRVHRVVRDGATYVLLQSAAYGRYLGVWLAPPGQDNLLVQDVYVDPAQPSVLWVPFRTAGGSDDVVMRHAAYRWFFLDTNGEPDVNWGRRWVVEAIPTTPRPPVLPGPTPPAVALHRQVMYARQDDDGHYDPNAMGILEFDGLSFFELRATLANLLNEDKPLNITLGLWVGNQGRLTPLVVDLPSNELTIVILVLATGSRVASGLQYPDVDADF